MTKPLSRLAVHLAGAPGLPDHRLGDARDLEWLETDGLGGFACGNVTNRAGRRYHGLLTAPLPGTTKRHLFLAALVENVATSTREPIVLSSPRLGGEPPATLPSEFAAFELAPWPTTRFQLAGGAELSREVLMPKGRHAVLVRYTAGSMPLRLELQPLLPFREADQLTFCNDVLRSDVEGTADSGDGMCGIRVQPYESLPAMSLTVEGGRIDFRVGPGWWRGVEYHVDLERGYGGHEDLFYPGQFVIELMAGESVTLAAVVDGVEPTPAAAFETTARARRAALPVARDFRARCGVAADDFLYRGPGDRLGILAGFPWFVEWGRDTFLALPGLTLARGQLERCAAVLSGALEYLQDGLLPNIFGATRTVSHYGSVDASLWFARAVLLYQRAGGDERLVRERFQPALVEIAECYAEGTAPAIVAMGIGGDDGGMIHAGTEHLNPTWMDAKPASGPVTPRQGCPVEIAALWCSLLAHLAELAELTGSAGDTRRWRMAAERAAETFLSRFWLADERYLADVWRPGGVDVSLRPNMVLAAALEFCPLSRGQRAAVFDRARRELLTPFGLRTLAADHPDYIGAYRGGPEQRDGAYHQGTVWPWLLGCYVELGLRADPANAGHLREVIDGLAGELDQGGLEHLSEVFDGDPPHRRGGTFAQAWNTAEVLRALALLDGDLPRSGDDGPRLGRSFDLTPT